MGEIRDNVKKNLGYYLTLKGISQKELADKLNVSQSAVTNWIKGKNSPDIEIVAQICNILDISVNELFGKNDNTLNPNTEQIAVLFNQLHPKFQQCALEQMAKLIALQTQIDI